MALRVVLISKHQLTGEVIVETLEGLGHTVVALLGTDANLMSSLSEVPVDLIVVNVKSPEYELLQQLHDITQYQPTPIVMFTEVDGQHMIDEVIRAGVNAYVVDGFEATRIEPVIKIAMARFNQMQSVQKELADTRRVLEERKIIDRAKGIIMEKKDCGEEEAYQSLRKVAMNKNQRIAEVAESVVSASEVLS